MDGNGRWATSRGLPRKKGHKQGAITTKSITQHCAKSGIKYLTLYAFSTENWARPKLELQYIFKLLDKYLKKELKTFLDNDIKFETIGDLSKFSKSLRETIKKTKDKTKDNKNMTQILALNYGSKDELVRAINKMQEKNIKITQENISKYLDTSSFPDVDLLIRTGGQTRLSNFLLWQSAYAELSFLDTFWPDFTTNDLDDAIDDFANRTRNFGAI
jgi:undecaprenyl diphosphate synthase